MEISQQIFKLYFPFEREGYSAFICLSVHPFVFHLTNLTDNFFLSHFSDVLLRTSTLHLVSRFEVISCKIQFVYCFLLNIYFTSSEKNKEFKINNCFLDAKHATVKKRSKYLMTRSQNVVSGYCSAFSFS